MQTPTTAGTCCGSGGGGGGIAVENDGELVLDPATTLDFSSDFDVTNNGGSVAGITLAGNAVIRAFGYVATGGEDLDGFPIPFTLLPTTSYAFSISIVLASGDPDDMYEWIALGKFADHLQIATTQPPAAGDRFEVQITLYTP